jgi:peptidoglycan/xylan/chitin deacetylase (PgdA/CDA1 family)
MGYTSEDSVFQRWYDQFDWMHEHIDDGVFILTMHPQVIGQAHRISRLEELVQHMQAKDDVEFRLLDDVAMEFKQQG